MLTKLLDLRGNYNYSDRISGKQNFNEKLKKEMVDALKEENQNLKQTT